MRVATSGNEILGLPRLMNALGIKGEVTVRERPRQPSNNNNKTNKDTTMNEFAE
jgi:hypothetical protein